MRCPQARRRAPAASARAGGAASCASTSARVEQRRRLETEGVRFAARGRVDLKAFGWRPGGDYPRVSSRSTIRSPLLPSPNGFAQSRGARPWCARRRRSSGSAPARHVGADLDRLRPLGVVAQRHARHAQAARLLLEPARVGEHQRRGGVQAEEVQVAERRQHAGPRRRATSPSASSFCACAGAARRAPASRARAPPRPGPRRCRAAASRSRRSRPGARWRARSSPARRRSARRAPVARGARPLAQQLVDHRVAGHVNALGARCPRRAGCRARARSARTDGPTDGR